jgi:hypothetical protein
MLSVPNLFLVGGNSRHSGKTTLACDVIRKFSSDFEVTAFKLTRIHPAEKEMHGNHQSESEISGYSIMEEVDGDSSKDTSQMLQAGAHKVVYVRATDGYLQQAFEEFRTKYDHGQPLVCESRGLRDVVVPGIFVMMMRIPTWGLPKEVDHYLYIADKIFYFDQNRDVQIKWLKRLRFENGQFYFSDSK